MVRIVAAPADMTETRAVHDFKARCEACLGPGPGRLVLDLTDVRRADSKLVASLVIVAGRARVHAVQLEVKPSAAVRTWLRVYGLWSMV